MRTASPHAGDPVECCVRGLKFPARFQGRDRHGLLVEPLAKCVSYRHVRARQILRKLTEREVMV